MIKFNVLDKQEKRMYLADELLKDQYEYPWYQDILMEALSGSDRFIPLMWTTFGDFFVGDIVKSKVMEISSGELSWDEIIGELVWEDGSFWIKDKKGYNFLFNKAQSEETEKLGTKFEQPELLEGK